MMMAVVVGSGLGLILMYRIYMRRSVLIDLGTKTAIIFVYISVVSLLSVQGTAILGGFRGWDVTRYAPLSCPLISRIRYLFTGGVFLDRKGVLRIRNIEHSYENSQQM